MTTKELQDLAAQRGIPVKKSDRKAELVEKLAAGTVDQRSAVPAVPAAPTPAAPKPAASSQAQSPVRQTGGHFSFPFDRSQTPDIADRLGRARGDEPLKLPNGGIDQGLMHLESETGKLWSDLAQDPRVPNSDVNRVVDIGHSIGTGNITLNEGLGQLRAMAAGTDNPAVAGRIMQAVDEMQSPPIPALDVPDNVPPFIRAWLEQVASVPTLRQNNRGRGSRGPTYFDQVQDLIQRVSAGDTKAVREWDRLAMGSLLPHESVDGVYPQREINLRTLAPPQYIEQDGKRVLNPEFVQLRDWRLGRTRAPEQAAPARSAPNPDEFPLPPAAPRAKKTAKKLVPPPRVSPLEFQRPAAAPPTASAGAANDLLDRVGSMTVPELKEAAKQLGIPADDMRKNQIIEALEKLTGG
jgi:hypothetical protein